jgi:hypothetical protein
MTELSCDNLKKTNLQELGKVMAYTLIQVAYGAKKNASRVLIGVYLS